MDTTSVANTFKGFFIIILLVNSMRAYGQGNETISQGAFIVNMGVLPQTIGNGLKPYGMVYDLLLNHQVPIKWVINPTKSKDGTDFTYNNIDYKGGPFIIESKYRTTAVNERITYWQSQGVVGVTTTSAITLPVHTTIRVMPKWTLDKQNGAIATVFFTNAGIPASAHGGSSSTGWKTPAQLNCCDDFFVMPHADPIWSTHANLYSWNQDCQGAIWLACHAGSALEDMFNPSNPSQQTNFLAEKTATASGSGPYSENALILWGNHSAGTLPYSYEYPTDPVMQFMGILDAATQNGSEQIYIPKTAGWRSTTKVGVYDPDHPQRASGAIEHRPAVMAWGPGLGDSNRGLVMLEASHSIAKATVPANIAAQRAFFNFSFISQAGKAVVPTITGITSPVAPGTPIALSFTVPAPASTSSYTAAWSSSCGGTFSPSTTAQSVTFTPPSSAIGSTCTIKLIITDDCGRQTFTEELIAVQCALTTSTTFTQPCFGGGSNGAIDMSISSGTAPFSYSWTRTGGGSGSGSGMTISGLTAGTYDVTVTSSDGCIDNFSRTLNEDTQISIAATPTAAACNGTATGSISTSIFGGAPTYTYSWNGGATTANRSGLPAGTYTLTVTDSKSCTASTSVTVSQPTALSLTPTTTPANCFGTTPGAISLAVSGGTSPYTYLWSDGATTQNRTNIAAGTYTVTVTDANACTQTSTNISVTQPAAALSVSSTQVNETCSGANNGSITATASGGTSPYAYDWAGTPTGDGTAAVTNLTSGLYTLTVTDANNCTAILSTTISPATPLTLTTSITHPTCPPGAIAPVNSDGAINLTVVGGTTPYIFMWTTGGGSGLVPTAEDQNGLTNGTYSVTVTDNKGCTATTSVTLTNLNPVPVQPGSINNN